MTREKGGPILVHDQPAPPTTDVAEADHARITRHIERTLNAEPMVWHEVVSDRVHVDVYSVPPARERDNIVLVSSGMSARPMSVPDGVQHPERHRHAELCLILPPQWKLDAESFADERWYWPVRLIKMLARFPHDFATWIWQGHSIPNYDPPSPYAPDSKLCGAVLIPPFGLTRDFMDVDGEPPLRIFQLLPVTQAEMDYKVAHGVGALVDRFVERLGDDGFGPIDPARDSVV
jgi:hypothetical protein